MKSLLPSIVEIGPVGVLEKYMKSLDSFILASRDNRVYGDSRVSREQPRINLRLGQGYCFFSV